MTIYLSEPLFDEPLFSCVGRYISSMNASPQSVLKHLFGYRAHPGSVAFSLSQVERVTRSSWGMSSREIAEQRTAYPYFAALLPPPHAKSLFEMMLHPLQRGHVPPVIRLRGTISRIRFCKACFGDDLRNGVPRHWRRAHQLPGVCVCPWHGGMLWQISKPIHIRAGYVLPQDLSELQSSQLGIEISDAQMHACHQVARLSYGLLSNNVSTNASTFREQFLKFCRGKTLAGIDLFVRRDVQAALEGYFGVEYLQWVGMASTQVDNYERKPFGKKIADCVMPARMVILAVSCKAMTKNISGPSSSSSFPVRRTVPIPIIDCVNKKAAHGPRHPVEKLRRRGDRFVAACSCGERFTFTKFSGRSAIDVQLRERGSTGRGAPRSSVGRAVQALRAEGKSRREIATSLELNMKTVANLERVRDKSRLHDSIMREQSRGEEPSTIRQE